MTFDNLTADADALREELGFERWAVLGHSFGGHVALEYALRNPERVSQLVLLDTAGDVRWSQERAAEVLAGRGYSPAEDRGRLPIGELPVDAIFSPVRRVNFDVERARWAVSTGDSHLERSAVSPSVWWSGRCFRRSTIGGLHAPRS